MANFKKEDVKMASMTNPYDETSECLAPVGKGKPDEFGRCLCGCGAVYRSDEQWIDMAMRVFNYEESVLGEQNSEGAVAHLSRVGDWIVYF